MNDNKSLAHTTWNCKYHIVFAPKYRRKVFYGEHKEEIGKILRELCNWKQVNIVKEKANMVLAGTLHKDSLNSGIVRDSKCLILTDDDPIIDYNDRSIGCVIRPVYVGKRKAGK